jgi:hypothetical protein
MSDKNAGETRRGRPFSPGNSGRPRGSRHKVSLAVEALLEGEAEGLTRKAIEKALDGDIVALRLCLDRIAPPRKDRTIHFELPPMEKPADAAANVGAIVGAVADGEITPAEASDLSRLIDAFTRTLVATDLEARVADLEKKTK